MVLFLLLLWLLFWQTKSEFSINRAEYAPLVFIVMLKILFCDCSHFAVVYGLLIAYPYMYKENEAVVFDVEEDTKICQENLRLVITTFFKEKSVIVEMSECDPELWECLPSTGRR